MIKTTRQYFCDACGKDITKDRYSMGIDILQIDGNGDAEMVGLDFCEDCAKSFVEWKRGRRERNDQIQRGDM